MSLSILNYDSYIDFLREFYCEKKKSSYGFSYASWAKQLNLKSKSLLYMVAQGSRLPSPGLQQQLCDFFEFNDRERAYFYDLVDLKKSKIDRADRYNHVIDRMQKTRPFKVNRKLTPAEFEKFSAWHTQTIFNLSRSPMGAPLNTSIIKSALIGSVSDFEIEDSIRVLIDLNLCENRDDRLYATCDQIETTHDLPSGAIRKYHREALQRSIIALEAIDTSERSITGGSLLTSPENLSLIKEKIRSFELELFKKFEDKNGTNVYQFSTSLFPLGQLNV